jgi:hypothetical protein
MQLSNNKKEPATERLSASYTPATSTTNHRQGKHTSKNKPERQPKKPTTRR